MEGIQKFYVIGLDDNYRQDFGEKISRIIATHSVFSGGKRHYELVRSCLPQQHIWLEITVPLSEVFEKYKPYMEVVVFASGDPLFFGFANTLKKYLPTAQIQVFPYFNSLQLLAHRMLLPYHDMQVVSLTGRPWQEFDRKLIEGAEKIGVLTDRQHTPAAIAARMLEYGYVNYRMTVGEKLGNAQELVRTWTLMEAKTSDFTFPNCLILERVVPRPYFFGIPESEFHLLDGRVRMITKMPVRLLTLSLLDLRYRRYFWDIGFCTGSISIECRLQFPHLQITAFEQRPEGRELMEQNSRKFGTPGIVSVIGDFTQADLSVYPAPDAVFIGGHGGKMEQILSILAEKMETGGVVVFNAVSELSRNQFQSFSAAHGFEIRQTCRVQVEEYNPIEVIKAVKL